MKVAEEIKGVSPLNSGHCPGLANGPSGTGLGDEGRGSRAQELECPLEAEKAKQHILQSPEKEQAHETRVRLNIFVSLKSTEINSAMHAHIGLTEVIILFKFRDFPRNHIVFIT